MQSITTKNPNTVSYIQYGSCFAKGTPILMSNGTTKYIEEIREGDYVMGHDMKAGLVSNINKGQDQMYLINQNDLALTYSVSDKHILILQVVKDHIIDYNDITNNATLYYFNDNKLITETNSKCNFFDKMLLKIKLGTLLATKSLWTIKKRENKTIAKVGSWIYITPEDYLTYPDKVKKMLCAIQLDWQHYNISGEYRYNLTHINVTKNELDDYYSCDIKSNPAFMLSDGTIVYK